MSIPLVVVVWDDAHGDAITYVTQKDLKHRPTITQTLGWLLRQDDAGVSIANERTTDDGEDYYRGNTFIPAALVRSVTPFVLGKVRKPREKVPPAPAPFPGPDAGG